MEVYWFEQTFDDVPPQDDWLGASEQVHFCSLRFAKRRDEWRLGRWTAKRALALRFGLPLHPKTLSNIEISAGLSGAPEVLFRQQPAPVEISLSHRAGRALCCVAEPAVQLGCDLEVIEPRSDAFVSDYFTKDEQQLVAETPVEERSRLVALLWSAKESALKALRTGLRLQTTSVNVSLPELLGGTDDWSPLLVRHAGRVFQGWGQQSGSFVRTLVAEPAPRLPIQLEIPQIIHENAINPLEAAHVHRVA